MSCNRDANSLLVVSTVQASIVASIDALSSETCPSRRALRRRRLRVRIRVRVRVRTSLKKKETEFLLDSIHRCHQF